MTLIENRFGRNGIHRLFIARGFHDFHRLTHAIVVIKAAEVCSYHFIEHKSEFVSAYANLPARVVRLILYAVWQYNSPAS